MADGSESRSGDATFEGECVRETTAMARVVSSHSKCSRNAARCDSAVA